MIGVILWINSDEQKAVIWCEDQGDLAFLGFDQAKSINLNSYVAGDVLEFDLETGARFRTVSNLTRPVGFDALDVASKLQKPTASENSLAGKVIPFPNPHSSRPSQFVRKEIAV